MRREERVTVQGPVKEQQPDGMSHRGGGGGIFSGLTRGVQVVRPLRRSACSPMRCRPGGGLETEQGAARDTPALEGGGYPPPRLSSGSDCPFRPQPLPIAPRGKGPLEPVVGGDGGCGSCETGRRAPRPQNGLGAKLPSRGRPGTRAARTCQ